VKLAEDKVDAGKDVETQIVTGDFSAMPLEQLLVVAQEVSTPHLDARHVGTLARVELGRCSGSL